VWSLERLDQIRAAREGGSITPELMQLLNVATQHGGLEMLDQTRVEEASWCSLCDGSNDGYWTVQFSSRSEPQAFDVIVLATGAYVTQAT
jgi:hypothetical protein